MLLSFKTHSTRVTVVVSSFSDQVFTLVFCHSCLCIFVFLCLFFFVLFAIFDDCLFVCFFFVSLFDVFFCCFFVWIDNIFVIVCTSSRDVYLLFVGF